MMSNASRELSQIYQSLLDTYGPQGWWPANTATEIIIGAILVQHAGWTSVQQTISRLRLERLLDFKTIASTNDEQLAAIINSAGMPQVKTRRLKCFAAWLGERYDFDLDAMSAEPMETLREQLLTINGIGPETADCILLYAADKPTFVVDTYTTRVLARHLLTGSDWGYDEVKDLVESSLPWETADYGEFHALLVEVGKKHCKKSPKCEGCPLNHLPHQID